jgi:hypothetical protein
VKPEDVTSSSNLSGETARTQLEIGTWEENGFAIEIGIRRRKPARPDTGLWEVDAPGTPEDPGRFRVELVRSEEGFWPYP